MLCFPLKHEVGLVTIIELVSKWGSFEIRLFPWITLYIIVTWLSFVLFCCIAFRVFVTFRNICSISFYVWKTVLPSFFPDFNFCALLSVSETICKKFFKNISKSPNHPLRNMFQSRSATPRNPCILRPPFAKTTRFYNSFIRFGRETEL